MDSYAQVINLSHKLNQKFFSAVAVSVLQYGYTICTQMKSLKKKLDRSYTRILHAILNKS